MQNSLQRWLQSSFREDFSINLMTTMLKLMELGEYIKSFTWFYQIGLFKN